ncbi:MAG: LiaF transmembrane domain-containing protein [Dorea sp.]
MKRINSVLWGVVLIAVGAVLALNAMGIASINIFFDGWWTLFIIVPCFIGLFSQTDKTGNLIGLLIGVLLFLACQNVFDFAILWKLIVPIIIVGIGLKMLLKGITGNESTEILNTMKQNGEEMKTGFAAFSGQNLNFDQEVFTGAELTAVFGGIKCDLRNAIIERDAVINTSSIFGGIDILVPDTVNVKVNSNSVFGGVDMKKHQNSKDNEYTIYINSTCMFGGVDVK